MTTPMPSPRRLRPLKPPLGAYLRPGARDSKILLQLLVEQRSIGTGLVADPCLADRQADLLSEAKDQGLERILDTKSLELSSPAGFNRSGIAALPWASVRQETADDFGAFRIRSIASSVADYARDRKMSAVLAPTHVLESAASPWLAIDERACSELRSALDSRGLGHVTIYYPLAFRSALLTDDAFAAAVLGVLRRASIDGVWLRVHPFGTEASGPLALRRYISFAQRLHQLGVPLVAERSGTVGVALLAFGAVGGIESGITIGERTNFDPLYRTPTGKPFLPPPRVYLDHLGAFLSAEQAGAFFDKRGMRSAHGCQNAGCCRRGIKDMLAEPRRHFVLSRAREVAGLTGVPESLRAGHYLEHFLRPATDLAIRAAEAEPSLNGARKRLESWRGTLGAVHNAGSAFTHSPPSHGRRVRRGA